MCIKLSVVIPTKNRQSILKNLISSFISQDIDYPLEFIIIDQTLNPMGNEALMLLQQIAEKVFNQSSLRYFHMPELSGLTQARNAGACLAGGRIILFLDDDIILLPGFMKGIIEGFDRGFDGVSGVQIQGMFDEGLIRELYTGIFFRGYLRDRRRAINKRFYKYGPYIKTKVLSGGITAYYKDIITSFKFDENLVNYSLGEDKEFSMRISAQKKNLAISTKALAYHMNHPAGKPNLFKRYEGKTAYIKYLQYKFSPILKRKLIFSTVWAILGTLIDAAINSITKHSIKPVKGALSGIKKAKKGFKSLEFIKIEEAKLHD